MPDHTEKTKGTKGIQLQLELGFHYLIVLLYQSGVNSIKQGSDLLQFYKLKGGQTGGFEGEIPFFHFTVIRIKSFK